MLVFHACDRKFSSFHKNLVRNYQNESLVWSPMLEINITVNVTFSHALCEGRLLKVNLKGS